MFERFTDRARKVCVLANQTAVEMGSMIVGTDHLLAGLLKEKYGVGCNVLRDLGVNLEAVISMIGEPTQKAIEINRGVRLQHTPRVLRCFELAIKASEQLNHSYVGTEHILLGLIRETEGAAGEILRKLGISDIVVEAQIMKLLGVSSLKHLEDRIEDLKDKITQVESTIKESEPALPEHILAKQTLKQLMEQQAIAMEHQAIAKSNSAELLRNIADVILKNQQGALSDDAALEQIATISTLYY